MTLFIVKKRRGYHVTFEYPTDHRSCFFLYPMTEYMLAAGLWNMTFLCGFSCDFANWQIWTTLHNIFKVIGQEYVVIFKYTGRFCLFSTLSDHTKASQNLKGTKKRNFEVCKITRETTQNAYFEQRVVTHTVPQKGQKSPALNSTIDRAKKFHHFSNLKNVFKTWFRRPTNDLIELSFLWFYMCFCTKKIIRTGILRLYMFYFRLDDLIG